MIPSQFVTAYSPLAVQAGHATNVGPRVILAQWAVETGWGSSALCVNWHNLAGIRWYGRAGTRQIGGTPGRAGTGFAGYASFAAFLTDYVHTLSLSYYAGVRAAKGDRAQMLALGASPWDAGHYRSGGVAGGSLLAAYALFPAVVPAPAPKPARSYVVRAGDTLWRIATAYYGHGALYPRIAAANHIGAPYIIHVGQRLVIP